VYHDGQAVRTLSGATSETRHPGDNSQSGIGKRCVEAKRYPLRTQDGTKYKTHNYTSNRNPAALPRPGLELGSTGARTEILIHPARGFLWSIGCINLARSLSSASADMEFNDSRARVIALIEDLKQYLGNRFPSRNGRQIPDAWIVIDEQL